MSPHYNQRIPKAMPPQGMTATSLRLAPPGHRLPFLDALLVSQRFCDHWLPELPPSMRSALNKSNPNWTWDLARRLRLYIPLQMRDRVRLSMRVQRRLYLSTRNAQAWDPPCHKLGRGVGCGQLHPFPDCYRNGRDTGTVGIPKHCVFGGGHRPLKR